MFAASLCTVTESTRSPAWAVSTPAHRSSTSAPWPPVNCCALRSTDVCGLRRLHARGEGPHRSGRDAQAPHPVRRRRRWALDGDALRFVRTHASAVDGVLAPVLTTTYARTTYVELANRARLTCDTGLVCSAPNGSRVSLPDELPVETKSAGPPTAAVRFLWRAGVPPAAISQVLCGHGRSGPGPAGQEVEPGPPPALSRRAVRVLPGWSALLER
jgi:hypothetical protein